MTTPKLINIVVFYFALSILSILFKYMLCLYVDTLFILYTMARQL